MFALSAALGACRDSQPTPAPAGRASNVTPAASAALPIGGARPVRTIRVPASYDAQKPSPLVLVLHGYGSDGANHAAMFTLGDLPERERIVIAAPDGTLDTSGARFWNAVPACCDFESTKVDDVAYLRGVVTQLQARYAIDPKRIYAVGHSNGGAMALRLACDAADMFAGVVDLSGPFYTDAAACHPSAPVSVRIMHGTRDAIVPYAGGALPVKLHAGADQWPTASARFKADTFATRDGCKSEPGTKAPVDFDLAKPGPETDVLAFEGCTQGSAVELWSMNGVGHAPSRPIGWQSAWQFLAAHPKP